MQLPTRTLPFLLLAALGTPSAHAQGVGGSVNWISSIAPPAGAEQFGYGLEVLGDLDGDGVTDYAVSAPNENSLLFYNSGTLRVYSGATNQMLYQLDGSSDNEQLGLSISSYWDFNADGTPDFLTGTPGSSPNGITQAGSVLICSGVDGSTLAQIDGLDLAGAFGGKVAQIGDVDFDGFNDILVGSPGGVSSGTYYGGSFYVYSGLSLTLLHRTDAVSVDLLGGSLLDAGDMDSDGVSDFLVGATAASPGGANEGTVYLYSGATFTLIRQFDGVEPNAGFGSSMDNAGDTNGDGLNDFLISAYAASTTGLTGNGAAYVIDGATGSFLYTFNGEANGDGFGLGLSAAEDMDGDGHGEWVFGAYKASLSASYQGAIYLFSSADGSLTRRIGGSDPSAGYQAFGHTIKKLGDMDGDGVADLLVSSPWSNNYTGKVHIVGFSPHLTMTATEVSESASSITGLVLDFPLDAAGYHYRTLLSLTGTGVSSLGVDIPLAIDSFTVNSFFGSYPFASSSDLQGTLNAAGDAVAYIGFPQGSLTGMAGRTAYFAAIAEPSGGLPTYSSVARSVVVVP